MAADPWILGVGGSHSGGACLLRGSELVVAVQEERLSGMKRHFTWLSEDSLGGMYSAVADQIFGDVHAAGKVMGLAPLRTPTIPVSEFLSVDGGSPGSRAPSPAGSATTSDGPTTPTPTPT